MEISHLFWSCFLSFRISSSVVITSPYSTRVTTPTLNSTTWGCVTSPASTRVTSPTTSFTSWYCVTSPSSTRVTSLYMRSTSWEGVSSPASTWVTSPSQSYTFFRCVCLPGAWSWLGRTFGYYTYSKIWSRRGLEIETRKLTTDVNVQDNDIHVSLWKPLPLL